MTATEMQKEAAVYLSRYKTAKAEVRDIEIRIAQARNEMMRMRGIDYTGGDMPKQQNHTGDLSDYIVRIDELIQDWRAAQDKAIALMREISAAINDIDHNQARRVLMLHFVDGYTYDQIAKEMSCDRASIYRWRKIGLRKVATKCH